MPNYFTIPEYAALKKCTRQTIYSAIKRGEINSVVVYGKTLITKSKTNEKWIPMESKKRF